VRRSHRLRCAACFVHAAARRFPTHHVAAPAGDDTLDGLGRPVERTTDPRHPFATITADRFRYDIDDDLVFTTDGDDAVATRYGAAHRPLETVRSDATPHHDDKRRVGEAARVEGRRQRSVLQRDLHAGKLQKAATNNLTQAFAWNAAGRTRSVITQRGSDQPVTQSLVEFDRAGHLTQRATCCAPTSAARDGRRSAAS
jgi:hypothetical protein